MSQKPFTIPIESIDLKELRKRTQRLRDEADAAQEDRGPVAEIRRQGFVPTTQPTPVLPLEPERIPGRAPAPPVRPVTAAPRQARATPQPVTPQPVTPNVYLPISGDKHHPQPFTDIPPETSRDKIQALLSADIVSPPSETLPLESIVGFTASPQPIPNNLETLLTKRKFQPGAEETRKLEVEAQRQTDAIREGRTVVGDVTEALEHVAQPFDVGVQTIGEISPVQFTLGNPDITEGELPFLPGINVAARRSEVPTLFSSGFNIEDGFREARQKFLKRPVGEQAALSFADPTILVPFLGITRKASFLGRLAGRSTKARTGLIAGVPGLPVAPPPRSLSAKMEALRELQEFGLKLDGSANEFAAPLRPMDERIGEVITTDHPLLALLLGSSGINPAIKRNTTVGRAITAYQMGRIESEELITVTLAAGYDWHFAQGLRGRLGRTDHILPIDRETGFFGDTGKVWQDVFSNPGDFDLTPAQRAMIDDYNQISNFEIPRNLDDVGITQKMRTRPDGEYYVFRDVKEIRDIEVRRHSDPGLQRHYEEATEGFTAGVRYDTDPRRSLELQLRWTYNKILRKQLDDVLEPLSVTQAELIPEVLRKARTNILKEILQLEKTERAIKSMIRTTGSQGRVAAVRTGERASRLDQLQREVDRLDDVLAELPVLKGVETEAARIELGNARRGVSAADTLLNQVNREVARTRESLAKARGKTQVTEAELSRLDRQFDRLTKLQNELTEQPIIELLQGGAPIPGSAAAIRQAATRAGRFGAVSTEATRASQAVVGTQRRFINLDDAREQLQDQVAQLADDVRAGKQLTREAKERLDKATSSAIQLESARGRTRGATTQAKRQQARNRSQLKTRTTRVTSAEAMEFDIQVRRGILASHIEHVEQQLIRAKVRRTAIREEYSKELARAERANQAPGALFGPNQPDEIAIDVWRKRFFSRPNADLLNDQLGKQGVEVLDNRAVKAFEILGNSIRFLSAVGDFAMPFIQGLPVLATNPNAWTRMTLRHYQAFFDPTVQARLVRDNIEDFQWLARHGVPVGDPEFFRALEAGQGFSPGRLLEFLPKGEEARRLARLGGKQTFGRFAASYSTGLGWSRALLYKSLKDSWKGTDGELARYIRNLTGGLDSKALGVGPGQSAAEGMWMAFSPRLLRSTVALTVDAFKPGTVVGRNSLRSLAQLATGATSLYVVTGLALGKDWDEIKTGLNPLNGKRFLCHEINGDCVGMGGQVRGIVQMVAGALLDPVSLASLDRFENPFMRFAGGRGPVGTGIVEATAEAVTGRDFAPFDEIDGALDLAKHIGKSSLPFALQGIIEGEGIAAVVAALAGARTSAETVFEKRNAGRERVRARLVASGDLPESTVGVPFRAEKQKGSGPIADLLGVGASKGRPELALDHRRLIDEQPEMQALLKAVDELQTKRKRPIQLLTNELDKIDVKQNNLIAEAFAQMGSGKAFRQQLSVLQRNRSEFKENERAQGVHKEAAQLIEEFEPSEAEFQITLTAMMTALDDPGLENEATGEYDFDLKEELLSKVKGDHPEMFDRVETFLRDDSKLRKISPEAADGVKQLQEDRETLKPYWDQVDFEISQQDPAAQRIYRGYQDMSPRKQTEMTTRLAGDSVAVRAKKERNRRVVNHVNNEINNWLEQVRLGPRASEIRAALARQEYSSARRLIQIVSVEEAAPVR